MLNVIDGHLKFTLDQLWFIFPTKSKILTRPNSVELRIWLYCCPTGYIDMIWRRAQKRRQNKHFPARRDRVNKIIPLYNSLHPVYNTAGNWVCFFSIRFCSPSWTWWLWDKGIDGGWPAHRASVNSAGVWNAARNWVCVCVCVLWECRDAPASHRARVLFSLSLLRSICPAC